MIISVKELLAMPEFKEMNEEQLQRKLDSIEILIRQYTNNNFQNVNIRFSASTEGTIINGTSPFIMAGDTVQISASSVNNGLYVVKESALGVIRVDKELFSVEDNLITKVEYPMSIKQGVIDLMKWEVANRSKVGIKQETLSRHSITYYDMDANHECGYPASLLGFLEVYKKPRF